MRVAEKELTDYCSYGICYFALRYRVGAFCFGHGLYQTRFWSPWIDRRTIWAASDYR